MRMMGARWAVDAVFDFDFATILICKYIHCARTHGGAGYGVLPRRMQETRMPDGQLQIQLFVYLSV